MAENESIVGSDSVAANSFKKPYHKTSATSSNVKEGIKETRMMIRPIAIYLPQFHPIPENDEWWGKGFTEWTNVAQAQPLFRNHYQPKYPADLGYYDLRCVDTQIEQAKMARAHGIYGFAYYHYWFHGKRLLHRPMDTLLQNNNIDLPFCLFWANETWSRRWLGEEKDILIKQTYSCEDDQKHIKHLLHIFNDKRYITVDGRPVFIIYRPTHFPDIRKTLETFRTQCAADGVNTPYFIASNSHAGRKDLRQYGFDAILNFEPQLGVLPDFLNDELAMRKLGANLKVGILDARLKIYDYQLAKEKMYRRTFDYPNFPCSFVNWDNSARRGRNGIIMHNVSAEIFEKYLHLHIESLKRMKYDHPDENFVFINAWNEWAEGNYLEPDIKYGYQFLNAISNVAKHYNS